MGRKEKLDVGTKLFHVVVDFASVILQECCSFRQFILTVFQQNVST